MKKFISIILLCSAAILCFAQDNRVAVLQNTELNKNSTTTDNFVYRCDSSTIMLARAIENKFGNKAIDTIFGFKEELPDLLKTRKLKGRHLSESEFEELIKRPHKGIYIDSSFYKNVESLSNREYRYLVKLRNRYENGIDMDSTTIFVKVIPESLVTQWINEDADLAVKGSIARIGDNKHLKTPKDLYFGMRLDYVSNGVLNLPSDVCYEVRYTTRDYEKAKVPNNHKDFQGWTYPFTSTGYTSGNNGRLGIPELKATDKTKFIEAGVFRIDSIGNETIIAVMDTSKMKFISLTSWQTNVSSTH